MHTNNTYQSLMLHWRNNNYSYLTKYGISDFGAQLPPLSFILSFSLLFFIITYYSRTREPRTSLAIITLRSILKFRLQIERSDSRRAVRTYLIVDFFLSKGQ